MSQVVVKHLDALAAQLQLALAQIDALRHALTIAFAPEPPSAAIDLPTRCAGVDRSVCALRDGEWNAGRRSFGNPTYVRCDGCGYEGQAASGD